MIPRQNIYITKKQCFAFGHGNDITDKMLKLAILSEKVIREKCFLSSPRDEPDFIATFGGSVYKRTVMCPFVFVRTIIISLIL